VKAYRVGDPLPRAWLVYHTVVADDDQALDLLNADDFDPRATAVLPPKNQQVSFPARAEPGSQARVVEALPGRLVLDIAASADGLLVVSQPYYPGWRATVDGEPVPIHRVDYLLQGVAVETGAHRVELSYHLSPLPAVVSLVVLAGCVSVLVILPILSIQAIMGGARHPGSKEQT
jgi:hypothetical protein